MNIKPINNFLSDDSAVESRQNEINFRDVYPSNAKFTKLSPVVKSMVKLPFDNTQYLNKPFLVGNYTWSTTSPVDIPIANINFPGTIFNTNTFLSIPWKTACFYRMRARAIVQVAGTINHAGILVAEVRPYTANVVNRNNSLVLPHAFLYANQASPVAVEIPFFNNLPLRQTNNNDVCRMNQFEDANDSYCTLDLAPWSTLKTISSVTSVQVSVHVVVDELEFYTPKPVDVVYTQSGVTQFFDGLTSVLKQGTSDALDSARAQLKKWTGLHNPNLPGPTDKHYMQTRTNPNLVDAVTQYDLLSPYAMATATTEAPFFHTEHDEMDMSYLLAHPQYLATAVVKSTDAANTLLFSRPITPLMPSSTSTQRINTIQSKLALCASFWSGDMELVIQSSMTNLQFMKLLVVLDYSRNFNTTNIGTQTQPSLVPYYGTMTYSLEFSGGGTIKCVPLPYMSAFRQLPVTTDWRANSLQHGVVRVYLQQPIVNANASGTDIDILFYMRAKESFQLHGFATRRFNTASVADSAVAFAPLEEEEDSLQLQSASSEIPVMADQSCVDINNDISNEVTDEVGKLRPIVNIRDIARRLYPSSYAYFTQADVEAVTSPTLTITRSVSALFRSAVNGALTNGFSPLDVVSDLFWGFRGGLKMKIVTYGSNCVSIRYVPPSFTVANGISPAVPAIQRTGSATTNAEFNAEYALSTTQFPPTVGALQMPIQEATNYARRAVNKFITTSGVSYQADSISVNDVAIPYMSPFDFVTNSSIYRSSVSPGFSSEEDLGSLIINVTPMNVGPDSATAAKYSPIAMTFYIGLADDARFGFLFGGDPYNPAFTTSAGVAIQTDPYLNNGPGVGSTNVTVPVSITSAGAALNYYTKTA